jgi:hypothetical protein
MTRLLVHSRAMAAILDMKRQSRRGELDTPLPNHARLRLEEIYRELARLQKEATLLNDEFLAFLISSAADEAHDQLRDDHVLREARNSEPTENGSVTDLPMYEERP